MTSIFALTGISLFTLIGIAIGMGMDVFSVSMAVASGAKTKGQTFRLSFHFGLFQFFMPIIGWVVGKSIVQFVAKFDHWVALAMLGAIGAHMIYEGMKHEEERSTFDRSRGWSLVMLSVATSIDALGIGLSFGVMRVNILFPAFVIGVASSLMSLLAIYLGRKMRSQIGHRMEIVGGLILIGIGIKLFFTV